LPINPADSLRQQSGQRKRAVYGALTMDQFKGGLSCSLIALKKTGRIARFAGAQRAPVIPGKARFHAFPALLVIPEEAGIHLPPVMPAQAGICASLSIHHELSGA
ncbi:hypothetical protein ACW73L_02785, partial [Methylolobus aquaticus]